MRGIEVGENDVEMVGAVRTDNVAIAGPPGPPFAELMVLLVTV